MESQCLLLLPDDRCHWRYIGIHSRFSIRMHIERNSAFRKRKIVILGFFIPQICRCRDRLWIDLFTSNCLGWILFRTETFFRHGYCCLWFWCGHLCISILRPVVDGSSLLERLPRCSSVRICSDLHVRCFWPSHGIGLIFAPSR